MQLLFRWVVKKVTRFQSAELRKVDMFHLVLSLPRFGRNKCWVDDTYKVNGKKICLVFNAQFDVGTFGTVTSASVGINTVARLNREKRARARRRAKGKFRKNRRGKTYRRR